jgi:hypothetical protein
LTLVAKLAKREIIKLIKYQKIEGKQERVHMDVLRKLLISGFVGSGAVGKWERWGGWRKAYRDGWDRIRSRSHY